MAFWMPAIAGGMALYGAIKGNQQEKKAQGYENRALDMADQQYKERAPLRQQGMRALGQIEAPMDMGNHMYDRGNPYAAQRGRTGSTANIGNWGQNTFDLDQVQAAQKQQDGNAAYEAELAAGRSRLPKGPEGDRFYASILENERRSGRDPRMEAPLPSGYGWQPQGRNPAQQGAPRDQYGALMPRGRV